MTTSLNRDQLIALMVAERDAELHGRGAVRPVEWPDAENRLAKAVEFRGVDDVGEVVVEHTRIESYDSQIDDRMAVSKIFSKFGPEIPDRWEAGYMMLSVAPGEMARVGYRDRKRVAACSLNGSPSRSLRFRLRIGLRQRTRLGRASRGPLSVGPVADAVV